MAKEKFGDRILTGKIRIACKYENAPTRYWETTKEDVVKHIIDISTEYAADGYVLTLRQLHYQFVKSNWIVNHDSAYKKLGNILDDCKHAGIVDWNNFEDRGRVPYLHYFADDVSDALGDLIRQYRVDRQIGQDNYLELWTEKDALSSILRRSTEKYHIQLVVNKGYTSSSAIYSAYQRIVEQIKENRRAVILYFGDHDPSGLDMVRDIRERLEGMLTNGDNQYLFDVVPVSEWFEVLPIGLTMEQIKKYSLPPNPTKLTDSRANGYIKKYGKICWEVDALNPKTLTAIVEKNIKELIDVTQYEKMLEIEKADIKELQSFIDNR